MGYCSNTNCARRFRSEDNNVDLMGAQPHYYRVRQVEPCHQSGALLEQPSNFLSSNLATGWRQSAKIGLRRQIRQIFYIIDFEELSISGQL